MKNASKHANHSAFLDKVQGEIDTEVTDEEYLSHKLLSRSTTLLQENQHRYNAILSKANFASTLKCGLFSGSLELSSGKEAAQISYPTQEITIRGGNTLLRGIQRDIEVTAQKITLHGIALDLTVAEVTDQLRDFRFDFNHDNYDLADRSRLTRVPPTTAEKNMCPENSIVKPPNMIIFGMIREGKGYEEVLSIAGEIHKFPNLANTRILMAGSYASHALLKNIMEKKFACTISDDILQHIADGINDGQDLILQIRKQQLDKLRKFLAQEIGRLHIEGELETLLTQQIERQQERKTKVDIANPSKLQLFIQELDTQVAEVLPIDLFLDVDRVDLPNIFGKAKYAVKYDEKGWANNASALINMLAYGCVLYTGWGMCTSKEVLVGGEFDNALVLPTGKYCLRADQHLDLGEEALKRDHFNKTTKPGSAKKNLVTPIQLLADIAAREGYIMEAQENEEAPPFVRSTNAETLSKAYSLLEREFSPARIAKDMAIEFLKLALSDGLEVNINGKAPLLWAIAMEERSLAIEIIEVLQMLLHNGRVALNQSTIFSICVLTSYCENDPNGRYSALKPPLQNLTTTVIFNLISTSDIDSIEQILLSRYAYYVDLEALNDNQQTFLSFAQEIGNESIITTLEQLTHAGEQSDATRYFDTENAYLYV